MMEKIDLAFENLISALYYERPCQNKDKILSYTITLLKIGSSNDQNASLNMSKKLYNFKASDRDVCLLAKMIEGCIVAEI